MSVFGGLAFRVAQRVGWLRYHLLLNRDVRVGEATIRLPVVEGQYAQHEDYERWLAAALRRIFARRPGAFIDVGANRGQTLIKVAAIDRERRYVGFEPNIACAFLVERLIELNGLHRHDILAVGLSDSAAPLQLLLSSTGTESSTTAEGVRGAAAYFRAKRVVVETGDTLLAPLELDAIAVIKVDVEGAELEVLRGLRGTIARHRPWLVFEVLPPALVDKVEQRMGTPERAEVTARNRRRALELQLLLKSLDYCFRNIHGEGELRRCASLDMGEQADLSMSNFIAVPRSEEQALDTLFEAAPVSPAG